MTLPDRRATAPRLRRILGVALLGGLAACAGSPDDTAGLVLRGGHVVTVNPAMPEVQALAVRDGRIAAVGSTADIEAWIGPDTRVVELAGRTAMPGFIEGHAHYMRLGAATLELNLTDATSWDEIVKLVSDAVAGAEPGELITGRGWHQEKWNPRPEPQVDGLPFHDA